MQDLQGQVHKPKNNYSLLYMWGVTEISNNESEINNDNKRDCAHLKYRS